MSSSVSSSLTHSSLSRKKRSGRKRYEKVKVFDNSAKKTSVLKPLFRIRKMKVKESLKLTQSGRGSPSTISDFSEITSQISSKKSTMMPFTAFSVSTSSLFQEPSTMRMSRSDSEGGLSLTSSLKKSVDPLVYHTNPFGLSTTTASSIMGLDEFGELVSQEDRQQPEGPKKKEVLDEKYVEEVQESLFDINLTETNTFFLFELYDESVSKFDENLEGIIKRNKKYENLKRSKVENKDKYINRGTQTIRSGFDRILKNKFTNTKKMETANKNHGCSEWKMYDEYKERKELEEMEKQQKENLRLVSQEEDDTDDDEDDDLEENEFDMEEEEETNKASTKESVFKNEMFPETLMTVERIIVQNKYFDKQNEYKVFYDLEDSQTQTVDLEKAFEEDEDTVELGDEGVEELVEVKTSLKQRNDFKSLWKFECDVTFNQSVNCMCWNKQNKEILAVGYGNVDFTGVKKGYVLCWSIKNPVYPERKIVVPSKGVSAVDFCEENPHLLAVGFNDGTVAIFDVRKRDNDPVLETSKNHNGTVWDLQWKNRGKDVGERLHSVGVDGRVNSWSIKKGLDCQEIMRIKRSGTSPVGIVSRDTGGLCIDFHNTDPNIYVVGSEDGTIYKCSCSYNEQYLQTFSGHTGPVYRVMWNPNNKNQFLSCSADWTIRLWNQEKENPLELVIEPYTNSKIKQTSSIRDIAWNPHVEKIFGSVSINGIVELWDIRYSTLIPRIIKYSPNVKYNCLIFSENSSSMLVGDSNGCIEILKPRNLFLKVKEDGKKEG